MSEVKVEKCKERVTYDNWGRTRPCTRWAREDGYCTQHHPRNVKIREDARSEKFERQMTLRMKRHTAMRDLKVAEEKIEQLTKENAKLEAQIKLMEEKAVTSFNCLWNGGWYSYADNE